MARRGFGILTVLLVLIILFCVKGTVMSKEKYSFAKQNSRYAVLEQEYLDRTRNLLEEAGYDNCGINMRRVTYSGGRREYTVLLHHRKLERLSEAECEALKNLLAEMEFGEGTCTFAYGMQKTIGLTK